MLIKVKFYPGGHTYFGKNIAGEGYLGEADVLASAVTMTIIKPNTPLADVKRGLEITLQDIELRINQEAQSS